MAEASSRVEAWDIQAPTEVTTLDQLLAEFGTPAFCKIDVEGFELEVLQGLTFPLPSFSFEFLSLHPERIQACLDLVERLGNYEFNWSEQETMRWQEPRWVPISAIRKKLSAFRKPILSGDIYARLISAST